MEEIKNTETKNQDSNEEGPEKKEVGKRHFPLEPSFFGADQDTDPFSDAILLEVPVHHRDKWAVSWSDLMMTMFILFAVLYIYQTGHRDFEFKPDKAKAHTSKQGKNRTSPMAPNKMPSQIFDEAKKAIQDDFINSSTSVEFVKDKAIRISIASDLLFDVGNAELKKPAKYQLRQIAKVLNQSNLAINVAGHTDITPIHSALYPTNWELSAARACKVARFMIESCDVEESRFFLTAHSYHQPIRENDTQTNRSLNRRVDIILMKQRPYANTKRDSTLEFP
jgi:chemotaxis protein MotB